VIEVLLQAEHALSLGLLDRAESLYRQVAAADPKNAIAVVGLSRVALERGDQHGALDLARQALAIDRENVAAQRLAQRLEEVITFSDDQPVAGLERPEQVPERRSWRDRLLRRETDR
jgi:predicted Zn-dependent protease